MRLLFVVVSTPGLELFTSTLQRQEPVRVQVFAAELAAERLDERIVGGLARAGDVQGHTALVSPRIHVPTDLSDRRSFLALLDDERLVRVREFRCLYAVTPRTAKDICTWKL